MCRHSFFFLTSPSPHDTLTKANQILKGDANYGTTQSPCPSHCLRALYLHLEVNIISSFFAVTGIARDLFFYLPITSNGHGLDP